MVKVACSHCRKNAAARLYLYVDTRDSYKDFPYLGKLTISVHLCDDCDKIFDDRTRIDVVYEVLAEEMA